MRRIEKYGVPVDLIVNDVPLVVIVTSDLVTMLATLSELKYLVMKYSIPFPISRN